jgi:hypothetical protein
MTRLRGRRLPLTVLVAAAGLLIASIAWASTTGWGPGGGSTIGPGGMMGGGMMGGGMMAPGISGDGPVRGLDDAQRAATRFADRWGLTVGEVMQFDNGFYAELVDPSGDLATEVLIDAPTGGVQVEFGPAMMWNTAYGMHPARAGTATVSPERAQVIAERWLEANRPGEHAGDADALPGYYTLHTLRGDQTVGMLSVNAATGAVWYHSWHGRFIAITEHPDTE